LRNEAEQAGQNSEHGKSPGFSMMTKKRSV
jgi:hypothetical protein